MEQTTRLVIQKNEWRVWALTSTSHEQWKVLRSIELSWLHFVQQTLVSVNTPAAASLLQKNRVIRGFFYICYMKMVAFFQGSGHRQSIKPTRTLNNIDNYANRSKQRVILAG